MGRYSEYNNDNPGSGGSLWCYLCKSNENGLCANMSSETNSSIPHHKCPQNEYCAVVRKEYPAYDPEKPEYEISFTSRTDAMTWDQCASYAKQSDSEFYRGREIWRSSLEVLGCKFWAKPNNETVIERVCKSVNTWGGLPHSSTKPKNGTEVKIYHNYCTTELCNTGDGRLKCHACEGSGLDDPCMLGQHNNDSNIVTCEPNEFCHIQRTVTLLNVTENENVTTEWNITRSCKVYSETDDDFQLNDGDVIIGGMATLACASDLCNSVDGNLLSVQPVEEEAQAINSAPGIKFSWMAIISLLFLYKFGTV